MREVKLFLFCKWDSSWVWGVRWLAQDTAVTELRAAEWLALLLLSEHYPASLRVSSSSCFHFFPPFFLLLSVFFGFFFFLLCFLPCLLLFIGVHHQRQELPLITKGLSWASTRVEGGCGPGLGRRVWNPEEDRQPFTWPHLIPLEFKMNYIISKFWLRKERGTFHL